MIAKSSTVILPEVHSAKKVLDTIILTEKRIIQQGKMVIENKLRLGQERAGIRCKKPQLIQSITTSSKSYEIPKIPMTQNITKKVDFPAQEQSVTN